MRIAAFFLWLAVASTARAAQAGAALPELSVPQPLGQGPVLAAALVSGAASPEFVSAVREYTAHELPPAILSDLLSADYRVEANRHVRQNREHLHEDNDYTGGYHTHGPQGNLIVIAQAIKSAKTGEWQPSRVWDNAVIHEIGHALAAIHGEREADGVQAADALQAQRYRLNGLSESPEFREAWRRDYERIPAQLKSETLPDRRKNAFFYFLRPDADGDFARARQETFAESFDVLLRGGRAAFNYDNFLRYFPSAMAEARRAVQSRYPGIFTACSQ